MGLSTFSVSSFSFVCRAAAATVEDDIGGGGGVPFLASTSGVITGRDLLTSGNIGVIFTLFVGSGGRIAVFAALGESSFEVGATVVRVVVVVDFGGVFIGELRGEVSTLFGIAEDSCFCHRSFSNLKETGADSSGSSMAKKLM